MANQILRGYSMDFTMQIEYAMRADGAWFSRCQYRDQRYGYKVERVESELRPRRQVRKRNRKDGETPQVGESANSGQRRNGFMAIPLHERGDMQNWRGRTLDAAMDNLIAWRLGEIVNESMKYPAGDYIDRGLVLRRLLDEAGFDLRLK